MVLVSFSPGYAFPSAPSMYASPSHTHAPPFHTYAPPFHTHAPPFHTYAPPFHTVVDVNTSLRVTSGVGKNESHS